MKRLQVKRLTATKRRRIRKDLVHAAGCVFEDCCVRRSVLDSFGTVSEAMHEGIGVPRTLLSHWAAVFEKTANTEETKGQVCTSTTGH